MKQFLLTLCGLLIGALAIFAQQPPAAGTQSQAQQNGANPPSAATAPESPRQQPGSSKLLPQAKTQEEYKAFQDAMAVIQKGDPAEAEAAADTFADKFKQSEISTVLYRRVMQLYQGATNPDKAIEVGKKILAIDSRDPVANVMVATLIAERVSDMDLDKDQRLGEAEKYANRAIETADTDFIANPGTSQQAIDSAKNMIRSMAYVALAVSETTKYNYAAAEGYFVKASSLPDTKLDAVNLLSYALVMDKQAKYAQALDLANRAMDASPAGSPVQDLIKSERQRLLMLTGATSPSAPAPASQTSKP